MYWLFGKKSQLSTENMLLPYCIRQFKSIWAYGIQLWGTASNSNIEILQKFQNKILSVIVDTPWYVTNDTLYQDLNMLYVRDEIRRHADKMKEHLNILTKNLMRSLKTPRKLKKSLPQDLCTWLVQFYRVYANGHIDFIISICHMYYWISR